MRYPDDLSQGISHVYGGERSTADNGENWGTKGVMASSTPTQWWLRPRRARRRIGSNVTLEFASGNALTVGSDGRHSMGTVVESRRWQHAPAPARRPRQRV